MKKEEIINELAKREWDDVFKEKLEQLVAKYVVYQEDPDTHDQYCKKYFINKEEALEDYNDRDYVPSGRWCYCRLDILQGDISKTELIREISIGIFYD